MKPEDDKSVSYVIGTGHEPFKSTCATADLAATAAIASRLFREFDPAYADRTLPPRRTPTSGPIAIEGDFQEPGPSPPASTATRLLGRAVLGRGGLWNTTGLAVYDRYVTTHYDEFMPDAAARASGDGAASRRSGSGATRWASAARRRS